MRIFAKTDIGKVRAVNQDAYVTKVVSGNAAFAVVCDGMGGANAGDIASSTASQIIYQYFLNAYSPNMSSEDIIKLLNNAITSANIEVFSLAQNNDDLKGMGTTVVAALITDTQAIICNIGDSRAYLINNEIKQVTRDHSIVQTLLETGKLSPEEARTHPKKNVITRALGVEDTVLCDNYCISLDKDDLVLLCTDGLTNFVAPDDILQIIKNNELEKTTDLLINQANLNGGRDNITAAVVSH